MKDKLGITFTEWVANKIALRPYVLEYLKNATELARTGAKGLPKIRRPSDILAERWQYALALAGVADGAITIIRGLNPEHAPAFLRLLLGAQPFYWSEKIVSLLNAAPPLSRAILQRGMFGFDRVYWSFETAYASRPDSTYSHDWLLLSEETAGLLVAIIAASTGVAIPKKDAFLYTECIPWGSVWDPAAGGGSEKLHQLLKFAAFLNSAASIEVRAEKIERSTRRRLPPSSPDRDLTIGVVQLRRLERRSAEASQAIGGKSWACHWWVRGHVRWQWYPSTNNHSAIFIAPHLKGPLDAPLLEKVYAVVR